MRGLGEEVESSAFGNSRKGSSCASQHLVIELSKDLVHQKERPMMARFEE